MVRPVSFCDNDRSLVFRTDDETIQVFDIASEKIIKEIPDSGSNTPWEKLLVSPDGRMLASASGNLIRLFDCASGSLLGTLRGHEGTVLSIAFHPNALRLVSSGKDGTVRVWDSKEFREVTRFRGHKAGMVFGVFDVIYSKDGKWIISGGADRSIKIWPHDAGDGNELLEQDAPAVPDPSQEKDWLVGSRDFIHDVDFSEDGRWVASAGKDGKCRVYDHATRELIYTFDRHQQSVGAIAFHPNGDWIASGEGGWEASQAGKIFIWKRTNGEVLRTFDGHTGPISSLHFSPDGQRLYSSVGNERFLQPGEIIAWDFASSSVRWKNSLDSGVSDMALSRDGKQLAAVVTVPQQPLKGKISLYDTELGAFEKEIDGDRSFYTSIDFSPNGRQLVAGARTSDISLIDIESGERIWKHSEHSGAVTDVAFHPSGKRIASASIDRSGKLWDAESGDVLLDFSRDVFELVGIEFSPSGQTLAYFGTFPYVSLRDAPQSTTLESPDLAWPIVFQDDFERGELGERWTVVNGRWDIEDGAAQGTLVSMLPGIAETHVIPKDWIPSTVAIELDAWAPQKLSIAINLTTPPGTEPQSAIGSIFLWQGMGNFNGGETGASIFSSVPNVQELSKTGKRLNWFEPGRKYRLKSIRQGERWQAFIDGIPVLESLIPADMSLPSLMLQAISSDVGATLYIDNLVVRAPRDAPDEVAAKSFVNDLQKDLKIRALVLDAIASKQDINEETRRIATRFAWAEVENMATRKQIIRPELSRGDRSEGFFLQVAKVLEADSRLDDNDWEVQQLLAIAYYRAVQYQKAKDAATAADATHRKLFGMSHPVSIAILSLSESKLDNEPAALHHQGDLRDLMRSRYWAADDSAREWSAQAYENVPPSPRDEQRARDEEEIRRITFEPQQEALCDQVYEGYFSTFTEDAVQIDGRSLEPSPYDVEFPIERWKNAQRVFGRSAPPLNARFVRSHADVEIVGDDAILRGTYTFSIPMGYWRWQSDERLKKTAQGWKIYHRRHGMTGIRFGENQEIDEDTDWSVRDAAVETAREQSNDSNLLDQLVRAWHLRDAFESVKPLTDNTQAQAGLWNRLADRAYSMADADEMLRAGRKAVELDPKIQGLPFLRALAFERYLPSEATDLGHGISVQTPTFMTQPSRLDFSVPGRVLAGWYPSDRSALLVFHAADAFEEGDTLEGETRSLAELFQKTFLATIHRQRMTVIDGSAAGDVIVEGDGNGRTLVAAGQGNNIGTVQRWITVQRDKEGIGLLLTAPTDEFDQRNTEFEEWLKRVKIQKQSPTTE
jgi:WD40 repeat protein